MHKYVQEHVHKKTADSGEGRTLLVGRLVLCSDTLQLKGLCKSMLRKPIHVNDLEGENEPGACKKPLFYNQCKKAP